MEWTTAMSLRLIELYRERPLLWDPTDNEYKLGKNKLAAWKEIANLMKTDVVEVKKKTESLLASFRRERQREGTIPSGTGIDEAYRSKWFAFQSMAFLMDKFKSRKIKCTSEPLENESFSTEELSENLIESEIEVPNYQETIPIITEKGTQTTASICNQSLPLRKRLCLKKKNGPRRDDVIISDALSIMKSMTEKKKNASEKDECYAYGEYIGKKLKSFDTRTRAILINEINNLIFKMDMNTRPSSITFQIEDPHQQSNLITSLPAPINSCQKPLFPMQSHYESFYSNFNGQTVFPRINSEPRTEVSSPKSISTAQLSSDENSYNSV